MRPGASAHRQAATAGRRLRSPACWPTKGYPEVRTELSHAACEYCNSTAPADVHMAASSVRARTWRSDMSVKIIAAAAIGPLIALGLLLIRKLRRKQLVAGEVSALRSLGNGRERG